MSSLFLFSKRVLVDINHFPQVKVITSYIENMVQSRTKEALTAASNALRYYIPADLRYQLHLK